MSKIVANRYMDCLRGSLFPCFTLSKDTKLAMSGRLMVTKFVNFGECFYEWIYNFSW